MQASTARIALSLAIAQLTVLSTNAPAQRTIPADFERRECPAPLAPLGATCGTYPVFEDRAAAAGRTIGLNVVVIPARSDRPAADAVVYLAGGPGQAATELAPFLLQTYGPLHADRDFLLVDQRGTGGSNPLNCDLYGDGGPQAYLGDFLPLDAVRACRERLERHADLGLYTTALAADDLDEVRRAFGYDALTLIGSSYGTRAALVYMRRHPQHVRAAILDGVTPPSEFIPRDFPGDAQRALDGVLGECEADAACSEAFPTLRDDARSVFARLEERPAHARIVEPETGEAVDVTLTRDLAAEAVRYMLYSAGSAAYVPVVLHQAARGDFGALAEFALFSRRNIVAAGSLGLYLSVTCAEDLPWIPPGAGERAADDSFLGDYRLRQQRAACELWPRGEVPPDFAEPVRAQAPTLLLSGQWDPVTPPRLGDIAAAALPNSLHILVPQGGHGAGGLVNSACVDAIASDFAARASFDGLDTSCLDEVRRPPFATENPTPAPIALPAAALDALAGDYVGVGAPIEAEVRAEAGRLRVAVAGGPTIVLVPIGPDRFRVVGMFGATVSFERADDALRLTLSEGGQTRATLVRR